MSRHSDSSESLGDSGESYATSPSRLSWIDSGLGDFLNNVCQSSWEARFGPTIYADLVETLAKLRQVSSVVEYQTQFEILANRTEGLTGSFMICRFLSGLRDDIRLSAKMFKPTTLTTAFGSGQLKEEKNFIFYLCWRFWLYWSSLIIILFPLSLSSTLQVFGMLHGNSVLSSLHFLICLFKLICGLLNLHIFMFLSPYHLLYNSPFGPSPHWKNSYCGYCIISSG